MGLFPFYSYVKGIFPFLLGAKVVSAETELVKLYYNNMPKDPEIT